MNRAQVLREGGESFVLGIISQASTQTELEISMIKLPHLPPALISNRLRGCVLCQGLGFKLLTSM